jgi:hypothetical protein
MLSPGGAQVAAAPAGDQRAAAPCDDGWLGKLGLVAECSSSGSSVAAGGSPASTPVASPAADERRGSGKWADAELDCGGSALQKALNGVHASWQSWLPQPPRGRILDSDAAAPPTERERELQSQLMQLSAASESRVAELEAKLADMGAAAAAADCKIGQLERQLSAGQQQAQAAAAAWAGKIAELEARLAVVGPALPHGAAMVMRTPQGQEGVVAQVVAQENEEGVAQVAESDRGGCGACECVEVEVMTGTDQLTQERELALQFAAESDIIDGPLRENSLLFHGEPALAGGINNVGIDLALIFKLNGVVCGFRTLELVRECGMPERSALRINQDVVKESFQGQGFIHFMNLRTAAVIRERLPSARWLLIEPTSQMYKGMYTRKGFAWVVDPSGAGTGIGSEGAGGGGCIRYLRPLQKRPSCFGVRYEGTQHSAFAEYRAFYCEDIEEHETLVFENPAFREAS